jgi:hypothetical protein
VLATIADGLFFVGGALFALSGVLTMLHALRAFLAVAADSSPDRPRVNWAFPVGDILSGKLDKYPAALACRRSLAFVLVSWFVCGVAVMVRTAAERP